MRDEPDTGMLGGSCLILPTYSHPASPGGQLQVDIRANVRARVVDRNVGWLDASDDSLPRGASLRKQAGEGTAKARKELLGGCSLSKKSARAEPGGELGIRHQTGMIATMRNVCGSMITISSPTMMYLYLRYCGMIVTSSDGSVNRRT